MGPPSSLPFRQLLSILIVLLCVHWPKATAATFGCPDIFQETTPNPTRGRGFENRVLTLLSNLTRPERLRELTAPLLVPRPVGSAGHAAVRAQIVGALRHLGWRVRPDEFSAETPLGRRRFSSVVATRPSATSPDAKPRPVLVLAAHYETAPVSPDFVGAADSAVPCGILLMLAEALEALRPVAGAAAVVRVVFFDGEEALSGRWTSADSLYGSRHLAARWLVEDGAANPDCSAAAEVEEFVLLDLIGGSGPRLAYAAQPGGSARLAAKELRDFARLAAAERRLRAAGQLPEASDHAEPFFSAPTESELTTMDTVEDDHSPFRRLGVPTLHLVPTPFPDGWHTTKDNEAAVNWGHSAAVARVLLAWMLEMMELRT